MTFDYTEDQTLAVALHEAGHATASHIYAPEQESSRLSIRMRGNSLGHHQSFDKEERSGAGAPRTLANSFAWLPR